MAAVEGDLSEGTADGGALHLTEVANVTIDEHRLRRLFRSLAVSAALLTLLVLLVAMSTIVWTFLHEFRSLAVDAQVDLVAAQHLPGTAAAASAALAPSHLVVSLGGFTTAIAALVGAFVVAATVLAIALVRASFTLAARGDDPAAPDRAPDDADSPVTLPTAEFVKAFGESLHTAVKGVGASVR